MDLVIRGMALSYSWCPSLKIFEDNLFITSENSPENFEDLGEVILRALADANPKDGAVIGLVSETGEELIDHLPRLEKQFSLTQRLTPVSSYLNDHLDTINDWVHKDTNRLGVIFSTSEDGSAAIILSRPDLSESGYVHLKTTDSEGVIPSMADLVEISSTINLSETAGLSELMNVFEDRSDPFPVSVGFSNLSNSDPSAMISLIHCALSVHHKLIPNSSGKQIEALAGIVKDPLYVNYETRPWLSPGPDFTRYALFVNQNPDSNKLEFLVLEECKKSDVQLSIRTISGIDPYLFLIPGDDRTELLNNLEDLERQIPDSQSLKSIADYTYTKYISGKSAYLCCLLGKNQEELSKEIAHAKNGIREAYKTGKTWSTPNGSYFTAHPLGAEGVAFVYPGAFNSYPLMGRELFYSFPGLHETAAELTPNMSHSLAEEFLYLPPSRSQSPSDNGGILADIFDHPNELIESGITMSVMHTLILDQLFDLKPVAALGYSLGEISMLWANRIWLNSKDKSDSWKESTLFKSDLVGEMNVVRNFWTGHKLADDFWKSYILKADQDDVKKACDNEELVFLTIENTPKEVVIAGEQNACQRVIKTLNCHALPMPFNASIHNPAMQSAIPDFVDLFTNETNPRDGIDFYSADKYQKLTLTEGSIAQSMANMTCKEVDFPKLVDRVYQDGARIFVEVGPQKTCSRWIEKILDGKPHAVIPINKKFQPDFHGLLKVFSLLASHGVHLNLSALFHDSQLPIGNVEVHSIEKPLPPLLPSEHIPDVENGKTAERPLSPAYFEHLDRISAGMAQSHQDYLASQQTLTRNLARMIQMQAGSTSQKTQLSSMSRALYTRDKIQAFTAGDHRVCFGSTFSGFGDRRIPRLPNGDLQFIDQVMSIQGQKEQVREGSKLTSEFALPEKAWYRNGDGSSLSHVSIMEIALQPCGFLSAYMGSIAGRETQDLYFRNLDGEGTLLSWPEAPGNVITNNVKLLSSSSLEDVIIQNYAFELLWGDQKFYQGTSSFGYFPLPMLENQAGLDGNRATATWYEDNSQSGEWIKISQPGISDPSLKEAQLPEIDKLWISRTGGKYSEGYLYLHQILPRDPWFYHAHFYQDPVMPGSLGVETMVQAMISGISQWDLPSDLNWRIKPGAKLSWKYRGQITPDIKDFIIDIHLKKITRTNTSWEIRADGQLWKESKRIYQVDNLTLETY
jgi:PfaB family protein